MPAQRKPSTSSLLNFVFFLGGGVDFRLWSWGFTLYSCDGYRTYRCVSFCSGATKDNPDSASQTYKYFEEKNRKNPRKPEKVG